MKKLLSVFLSFVIVALCAMSAPFYAYAREAELEFEDGVCTLGEAELEVNSYLSNDDNFYYVCDELKKAMIMRAARVQLETYDNPLENANINEYLRSVYYYVIDGANSISSVDGEYINYHMNSFKVSVGYDTKEKNYVIVFDITYKDTRAEELLTHKAINEYLATLDLDSYSDYELLREFHDYVLDICSYNYYDLYYKKNFTAYGVFCLGKAVCQGYALAFYRLCREVGIDCCITVSDPNEGCHAWNLVWCGDRYYYVDCTWDDSLTEALPLEYLGTHAYDYFLVDYETLQSKDSQSREHKLDDDVHDNDYFNNKYRNKIATDCYDSTTKSIANCVIARDGSRLSYDGEELVVGTDYTVRQTGDSYAVITGKGDFKGTSTTRDCSMLSTNVSAKSSYKFTGSSINPTVSVSGLTEDKDYQLLCYDSQVGKGGFYLIGIGRYSGVYYGEFDIYKADINDFKITLSYTQTYYNGTVQKPKVTVKGLSENWDYTVKYDAISDVGTGYVYVKGKGNCIGSVTLSYTIVKRDIASKKIKLDKTSYEYNGYERKPGVYISGLRQNQDYKVTYKNNVKPGKASVTIKGMGCYGGKKVLYFTIKPSKPTIKKLKTSKKSITVSWGKVTGASGYQIEYSTKSNFSNSKTKTVKSDEKSKKISKLKKGKKYYVRVRAYKTIDGKKTYGSWSAKKSISCK